MISFNMLTIIEITFIGLLFLLVPLAQWGSFYLTILGLYILGRILGELK